MAAAGPGRHRDQDRDQDRDGPDGSAARRPRRPRSAHSLPAARGTPGTVTPRARRRRALASRRYRRAPRSPWQRRHAAIPRAFPRRLSRLPQPRNGRTDPGRAWRSLWERGPRHGGGGGSTARCGGDGKGLAGGGAGRIQGSRPFCLSTAARAIWGRWGGDKGKQKLTLKDVAKLLRKKECRRVVVMAGAGISTPSGIPDFRSPGSGLYSNLEQYNIPYPEAIFELGYFFINPKPFFTLAKELYPGNYHPNSAHYFLRLLHDKGLLLRLYTQNIDGLERVAGIPPDRLVEAHGTFATATCTVCQRNFPGEDFRGDIMEDRVPRCPVCTGVVKPDIVFFGEQLPQRFLLHLTDFPMADLLFVIGTSLEVEPFASLAGAVRSSVPRVLINQELVGPFAWQQRHNDVAQLGDVVRGVEKLVELLGWNDEMQTLIQKEKEKLDAKDK